MRLVTLSRIDLLRLTVNKNLAEINKRLALNMITTVEAQEEKIKLLGEAFDKLLSILTQDNKD